MVVVSKRPFVTPRLEDDFEHLNSADGYALGLHKSLSLVTGSAGSDLNRVFFDNDKVHKQTQNFEVWNLADVTAETNIFLFNVILSNMHTMVHSNHLFSVSLRGKDRRLRSSNSLLTSELKHKSLTEMQPKKVFFSETIGEIFFETVAVPLNYVPFFKTCCAAITFFTPGEMSCFIFRAKQERGSGFGFLVGAGGRIALLFAKKVLLPAVKPLGEESFVQNLP